jgi:hypothetical protein
MGDSKGPTQLPPAFEAYPQIFALLGKIIDQLHQWIDHAEMSSPTTALGYVRVASAVRAFNVFRSIKLLLAHNHWEDALILMRSLFELLLNVEEVCREERSMEYKARLFLLFNEMQRYQHARADRQYEIDTGRSPLDDATLPRLDKAAEVVFAVFRQKNRKGEFYWQKYWCGKNVYDLARDSTNTLRLKQYRLLYSYASDFTHSSPLSVMSTNTAGGEWEEIQKIRDMIEKQQCVNIVSFSVTLLLEILYHVGNVFPDYNVLWTFEVLADLHRSLGIEPPPMPPQVKAAYEKWTKSIKRPPES